MANVIDIVLEAKDLASKAVKKVRDEMAQLDGVGSSLSKSL
jgi:hypothetical protein